MTTFMSAADRPDPEKHVPDALPWVYEAGKPYYRWLFGGEKEALRVLDGWMRQDASEVSITRVLFVLRGAEIAGGYLAFGGEELQRARKADMAWLLKEMSRADLGGVVEKLRESEDLFSKVGENQFYLSSLGVLTQFRRSGLGQALLERYLRDGEDRGYSSFLLDVHADNEAAMRCYEKCGFTVRGRSRTKDEALEFYSMGYEAGSR